jgi:hypothetical protein
MTTSLKIFKFPILFFLILLVLFFVSNSLSFIATTTTLSSHALKGHKSDAVKAWDVTAQGTLGNRYRCPQDPTGYEKVIYEYKPGQWAMVVFKIATGEVVTAFTFTSEEYYKMTTKDCDNKGMVQ